MSQVAKDESKNSPTTKGGKLLSIPWQYNAALLSRPADLSALVPLSRTHPKEFLDCDLPYKMVTKLLNNDDEAKSDKDTKLDVITILTNLAYVGGLVGREQVKACLMGVSAWFDDYLQEQGGKKDKDRDLHKAMLLLLCRAYEYKIKTEDVLELTCGDRALAVECVVGILEEGETYSLQIKQRRGPAVGKVAQWEHQLQVHRHEKPLVLQLCRLLRGFTHPATYFQDHDEKPPLYSVNDFAKIIDGLQELTMKTSLIEKLCMSLEGCLFPERSSGLSHATTTPSPEKLLDEEAHLGVASLNQFLQNLYNYASHDSPHFRHHVLHESTVVPRLIFPYITACVSDIHSPVATALEDQGTNSHLALLVQGLMWSLRTLVFASFRAAPNKHMLALLRRCNPTALLVRAAEFLIKHEPVFLLLLFVNINMGSLDLSLAPSESVDALQAHSLLQDLATVFKKLPTDAQKRVLARVVGSGALPLNRDTPSYIAVLSVLEGGATNKHQPTPRPCFANPSPPSPGSNREDLSQERAEAKREAQERLDSLRKSKREVAAKAGEEAGAGGKMEFRLLGDLPDLVSSPPSSRPMVTAIQLPIDLDVPHRKGAIKTTLVKGAGDKHSSSSSSTSAIPAEFLCAINGHVMKDPVRTPQGHVLEKATIELWLKTRGSICPLSGEPLCLADLQPDSDLRARILRWRMNSLASSSSHNTLEGDDLYNF